MYPAKFTYHAPWSVEEALGLMAEHEDSKLIAGGHSLLPTMKMRLATPAHLIDMKNLRSLLSYIHDKGDHIAIGALTTYQQIESSSLVQKDAAIIAQTVAEVGDMQVRNMGTLGGSIAHADPAGDPPAAILASDATMVIQNSSGERSVAASEFFQGFFETAVGAGEILKEIRVPKFAGGSSYQKFKHPASGYAVAGVAVCLSKNGNNIASVKVGVTGASDGAYRASAVEDALTGQAFSEALAASAAAHAMDGIDALEDPFADAEYRGQIAKTLAKRAIIAAWNNA